MNAVLTPFAAIACAWLVGCATQPVRSEIPEFLFADALFGAPIEKVGAANVFTLSDAMRDYARREISPLTRKHGAQGALVEALYRRDQLRLEYASDLTRNAAQTFEARAGNCLSLVVMTAAFAKELGIPVRYQSAFVEEPWSRKGDLLIRSGHVNITLDKRIDDHNLNAFSPNLTIDFLPQEQLRNLKTVEIPEMLVVAMFLNNRAVESLVHGQLDDAYAWSREAVRADPAFLESQNTLGVVYLRRGAFAHADAVFNHVLAIEPTHTRALANLAEVASRVGRHADAARLRARLAQLEPEPPLHFFNLGLAAMQREDFHAALKHFAKEARSGDSTAEVHFWLGLAHYRLGDKEQAASELQRAAEVSTSRRERDLYSAKLSWLRSRSVVR